MLTSEVFSTVDRHPKVINDEWLPLIWNKSFSFPGMSKKRTLGGGSCFFHAIADACSISYREGKIGDVPISKNDFVRKLRFELADKLEQMVSPTEPLSLRYYDIISRGELANMSSAIPNYKLENMQTELRSGVAVDNMYNEFISLILNKNIFLLNAETQDVYITGNDMVLLYENRESIVILINSGHYELVGIVQNNSYTTLFPYNSLFITYILNTMHQRISKQITI